MMSYNPPYYPKIYDALGLRKAHDLQAYYIPLDVEPPERFTKIMERVRRQSGIKLRSLDLKHLDKELPILHRLYNVTLDRNWGFVPITLEDLQATAKELKTIADPALVLIAEKNGEAVGFSLALPNINELMWRVKTSRFAFMRVLRFLWLLKMRPPKEARWMAMGVAPEYRNLGIAPVFYYETLMRGRKRSYIGGEISWIDETNEEVFQGLAVMRAHRYKNYRIYEKVLSR
jgi:GNAT superfamily N-acetyltransferase